MNRASGRSALQGLASALRFRRANTSTLPLWRLRIADDGVTILLMVTEAPEWETATTLRLYSDSAAQLAHELKRAARATSGRLSGETFIPGEVLGMRCSDASDMLRVLGLTVVTVDATTGEEWSQSALTGEHRVAGVDPSAETVLRRGSSVRLFVAGDQ